MYSFINVTSNKTNSLREMEKKCFYYQLSTSGHKNIKDGIKQHLATLATLGNTVFP